MSTKILHCIVTTAVHNGTEIKTWTSERLEDPKEKNQLKRFQPVVASVVFRRDSNDQYGTDVRPSPPFWTILPCPYCGVQQDRDHDPLLHVDKRLGTLIPA